MHLSRTFFFLVVPFSCWALLGGWGALSSSSPLALTTPNPPTQQPPSQQEPEAIDIAAAQRNRPSTIRNQPDFLSYSDDFLSYSADGNVLVLALNPAGGRRRGGLRSFAALVGRTAKKAENNNVDRQQNAKSAQSWLMDQSSRLYNKDKLLEELTKVGAESWLTDQSSLLWRQRIGAVSGWDVQLQPDSKDSTIIGASCALRDWRAVTITGASCALRDWRAWKIMHLPFLVLDRVKYEKILDNVLGRATHPQPKPKTTTAASKQQQRRAMLKKRATTTPGPREEEEDFSSLLGSLGGPPHQESNSPNATPKTPAWSDATTAFFLLKSDLGKLATIVSKCLDTVLQWGPRINGRDPRAHVVSGKRFGGGAATDPGNRKAAKESEAYFDRACSSSSTCVGSCSWTLGRQRGETVIGIFLLNKVVAWANETSARERGKIIEQQRSSPASIFMEWAGSAPSSPEGSLAKKSLSLSDHKLPEYTIAKQTLLKDLFLSPHDGKHGGYHGISTGTVNNLAPDVLFRSCGGSSSSRSGGRGTSDDHWDERPIFRFREDPSPHNSGPRTLDLTKPQFEKMLEDRRRLVTGLSTPDLADRFLRENAVEKFSQLWEKVMREDMEAWAEQFQQGPFGEDVFGKGASNKGMGIYLGGRGDRITPVQARKIRAKQEKHLWEVRNNFHGDCCWLCSVRAMCC